MLHRFLVPLVLLLLALVGCASRGPSVQTDFDASARIGRDRSYSWISAPDDGSPLLPQQVVAGIDSQLRAAGWKLVAHGDIEVSAHVTTRDGQNYNSFYTGIGHDLRWLGVSGAPDRVTMSVDSYQAGTLVIDMFDAKTRRAIWRGNASGVLPDDPAQRDAAIARAIDRLFAGFPPQGCASGAKCPA